MESLEILPANHLLEISAHLHDRQLLEPWIGQIVKSDRANPELRDIIGQHHAKRAMELAATGGHNLLFYGPPGTGKTMLASRLPEILPRLSNQEALEVAAIHSIAGKGLRKKFRKGRSARLTTLPLLLHWWVAVVHQDLGRYLWRIRVFSF